MYNAAERQHVKEATKASRLAERQRKEVIVQLLSTEAGRAYYLDKLEAARVFATSFAPNALHMAFAEGERNQGLQLLADIMHYCPEQYVVMMQERNIRDAARDAAQRRNDAEARSDGDVDQSEPNSDQNFDNSGRWIGDGPDPRSDYERG